MLNVKIFFTNITLEEIIDNTINDIFCTTDKVNNLEMDELKQPLTFTA